MNGWQHLRNIRIYCQTQAKCLEIYRKETGTNVWPCIFTQPVFYLSYTADFNSKNLCCLTLMQRIIKGEVTQCKNSYMIIQISGFDLQRIVWTTAGSFPLIKLLIKISSKMNMQFRWTQMAPSPVQDSGLVQLGGCQRQETSGGPDAISSQQALVDPEITYK